MSEAKSLRTFLGAKDYGRSIRFYETLGFQVKSIDIKMSLVRIENASNFYLQDYYVKEWCENSMMFLEVGDLESHWKKTQSKNLTVEFPEVKISEIQHSDWGSEYFIHDPSGILWHIGKFKD